MRNYTYYLIFFTILVTKISAKDYYVLNWPQHDPGFFSAFHMVLCCLDKYEKSDWAGFSVSFCNRGIYLDHSHGQNVWSITLSQ